MSLTKRLTSLSVACALVVVVPAGGSVAARKKVPAWAQESVDHLVGAGLLDKKSFDPNAPMLRKDFKVLITGAFGRGYKRTKGKVTAGEVGATLVRVLGYKPLAKALQATRSPDGWDPEVHSRFGTEIVVRELGLRFNRPTAEEAMEAAAGDKLRQADIAYAVSRAMRSPSTYSASVLNDFELDSYDETRRAVVSFALSLAGAPYVWAGEWISNTPSGYPYGAQAVGGFDCSGFIWYVLQQRSSNYSPIGRSYKGWSLPERSSAEMAKATPRKQRLGYKKLKPADIILFAPNGRDSKAKDVYHAGLYLGQGWMIHSSGSRAGVSIANIGPDSYWKGQMLWGRRIITD